MSRIPKVIFQTWKTHTVPDHWKKSPESIMNFHPDWKYVLFSDEDNHNFVKTHFPEFLPYFDGFKYPIQRADAIRYMWLYINGGVYMDLDFLVQKPIDELFNDGKDLYLVPSGNIKSSFTNSFMASSPRHPFWLEVIEEMKKPLKWWVTGKHMEVMSTTGPWMITRVARKYVDKDGNTSYGILPVDKILPCSVCNKICIAPDSHLVPLRGMSWCDADSHIYNFVLCNKQMILIIVILLIFVLILLFLNK